MRAGFGCDQTGQMRRIWRYGKPVRRIARSGRNANARVQRHDAAGRSDQRVYVQLAYFRKFRRKARNRNQYTNNRVTEEFKREVV